MVISRRQGGKALVEVGKGEENRDGDCAWGDEHTMRNADEVLLS